MDGCTRRELCGCVRRIPRANSGCGIECKRIHVPGGSGTKAQAGTGVVHIAALFAAATEKGVDVRTETPATGLVVDENNAVVGVKAMIAGEEKFLKAKRGVVIATSGFDHNVEMA